MKAKFQKGDKVSMADETPQVEIDRGYYERDDVLTVLTMREHRLNDGARVWTYAISGGRWFYEHNLKAAPTTLRVETWAGSSAPVAAVVHEPKVCVTPKPGESLSSAFLREIEVPAIPITGPGKYRTRSGQIAYVRARGDHPVWAWEGDVAQDGWKPRKEKWRESGHAIAVGALDACDLVERIGDLR